MDAGFFCHIEYWFENGKVKFYPQEGYANLWPTGYRLLIDGHKGETYLATNIPTKPRPSRKYAKRLLERIIINHE